MDLASYRALFYVVMVLQAKNLIWFFLNICIVTYLKSLTEVNWLGKHGEGLICYYFFLRGERSYILTWKVQNPQYANNKNINKMTKEKQNLRV